MTISTYSCKQLELDSIKMEYSNAQFECNAADERAKILASEVIGLEEKVKCSITCCLAFFFGLVDMYKVWSFQIHLLGKITLQ